MVKKGRPPKKQKKLKGGPPKLSAYNRFVKRFMKGRKGKATANMKKAAAAWNRQKRGKPAKVSVPRAKPRKGRVRSKPMSGKKFGGRRMGFNQQKLFKLIRMAALVAPMAVIATGAGSPEQKLKTALAQLTGYDIQAGNFQFDRLQKGWGPFVIANLVTYGVPKLNAIIKGVF